MTGSAYGLRQFTRTSHTGGPKNAICIRISVSSDQTLPTPACLSSAWCVFAMTSSVSGAKRSMPGGNRTRTCEWLADKLGKRDVGTLRQYVDLLPQSLVRRFISEDRRAVIVSGRVPDKDAAGLLSILDQLDQSLSAVRAEHPGYTIAPTGLSVIDARNSAGMINKLNRGLTIEFAFVAAFIGLAFRSWPVTLASLTPGLFPVVSAGALLRLLGVGLQFSSVVALTVSSA